MHSESRFPIHYMFVNIFTLAVDFLFYFFFLTIKKITQRIFIFISSTQSRWIYLLQIISQ